MAQNLEKVVSRRGSGQRRIVSLGVLLAVLSLSWLSQGAEPDLELRIKAAFLYKFLFFAELPEKSFAADDKTIVICILGSEKFADLLQGVAGSRINDRRLEIRSLGENADGPSLRACQVLFIEARLRSQEARVLQVLGDSPVLTVGESEGFLRRGGMVRFVTIKERLAFEINRKTANRVGIRFRSKLLRLAVRVIEEVKRNGQD